MRRLAESASQERPAKPHAQAIADHLQLNAEAERDRLIALGWPFVWLLEIDERDQITHDSDGRAVYWPVEHRELWDPHYRAVCSRNDEWTASRTAGRDIPPCLRAQGPKPPPGIAQCATDVYDDCRRGIMRRLGHKINPDAVRSAPPAPEAIVEPPEPSEDAEYV